MFNNKKDVKQLEQELIDIKIQNNLLSEEYFNKKINERWEELKTIEINKNLKAMPIDTISTLEKRMPINELMYHGLETIYDVRNKDLLALEKLNGIGFKSAEAIANAVSKIKASVYKRTYPQINPDNLSKKEEELIETIYKKRHLIDKSKELNNKITEFYDKSKEIIETAKAKKGKVLSLFQSSTKKEQIDNAFEELNKKSFLTELDLIREEITNISIFKVNKEEVINHFIKNNASYYTEIEKITNAEQPKESENLPTEIVELVNNYPINLTGLKLDLRGYQEFGAKYSLHYKKTLLGDEMGLGKTIQALAMINHLSQEKAIYSIVVSPLSILANWKREIKQHTSLNTFVFHGKQRDVEFIRWKEDKGILLTTYEHTLRMNKDDINNLDVLIVDEAHYVKNPEAKRSKSVYELASKVEYVSFMSGTPLENRLEEMKQLINILQPDIANKLSEELYLLEPRNFKKTIAPVYLRRNREDVLGELPELEIIPHWTALGNEEKAIYEQAVKARHLMDMRRAAWRGETPEESPKLEKLLNICEEANDNGHKVLIFSFFKDVISTAYTHLRDRAFEPITGDVPNDRRQEIIDEFTNADPGSVLISQITAGGVGLNIQAANIIILCEPQWKPSTEEQAISRSYRMGQSRNVVVYRLLTEDSIDESMLEILGQKSNLFDLYARDSEVAELAEKGENEIDEKSMERELLKLEEERLKIGS